MITRAEEDIDEGEDPLPSAGHDQDVSRVGRVVQGGDFAAQERVPGRLRVAEAQVAPERSGLVIGMVQEFRHGPALDIAGT